MRRLVFTVAILAVIDPFVVPLVTALERRQYESPRVSRFENSDLFTLGPIVDYLRDHPRGPRKRVVFFGNSVLWGYGITDVDTVPAQFQHLAPAVKVLNFAFNGASSTDAYLIARRIVDSIDVAYLLPVQGPPQPLLSYAIDIAPADQRLFAGRPSVSTRLGGRMRRTLATWKLYGYAYRLQAALWGTSTRLFVYIYKGPIVRAALGRAEHVREPPRVNVPDVGYLEQWQPVPPGPAVGVVDAAVLDRKYGALFEFARLMATHRRRAVILTIEGYTAAGSVDEQDRPALTTLFAPYIRFVSLPRPPGSSWDALHFTPQGAATFAAMLHRATALDAGLR